jgi:hypothetical protein
MDDLLKLAIEAHGGLERWRRSLHDDCWRQLMVWRLRQGKHIGEHKPTPFMRTDPVNRAARPD